MAASPPLVSVCLPTYNRSQRLRRAIETVQASRYPNLDIVVSDNASPDDTREVVEAMMKTDARIRYFRSATNVGPTPNFEFARAQARGKYFMLLGDDDYLDPDYLAGCVAVMEADPEVVLAYGPAAYHRGDGNTVFYGNFIDTTSSSALLRVARYLFQVRDNAIFCGLYHREAVRNAFMPNVLAGDRIWITHVLVQGKAVVVPGTYIHREFGDTISTSYERIVATIGAPPWHARFRFLAMACNNIEQLNRFRDFAPKPALAKLPYYLVIAAAYAFRSLRFNAKNLILALPLLGPRLKKHVETP